nr:venom protein [Lampona murina]
MNCLKELCLLVLVAVVVSAADRNQKPYKVVCYLGSWANYRPGDAKFLIEHIDPFLCTHLIYGFAKLEENEIRPYDTYLDLKVNWGLGAFERFNNLKQRNPQLSTLIAIGGWNEGSKKYSVMAADPNARATFIKSVIAFCKKYNFDGLDMDWEYPANRGGVSQDKENYITLLKELKAALEPEGLLLSAAVSAGKNTIDTAYDIPKVSQYLDFINVMAYDLHGSWEKQTGHNAPLYARDGESEADKILNVDYAIQYWINQGADRKKIILGMGLYGRSFTLKDANNNGLGAPATGPGSPGEMTQEPGMLGYNEICLYLKRGWTEVFTPGVEAPFAYQGNQWVGYDDQKSIGIKVDYLIKQRLGGGMVWSLETDDFRGKCYGEKFPLLTKLATKLNGNSVISQTVPPEQRTTRQREVRTTAYPGELFRCPEAGYFRDPSDCSKFYYCVAQGNGEFARHTYSCGDNAAFDEVTNTCNFREKVPGC